MACRSLLLALALLTTVVGVVPAQGACRCEPPGAGADFLAEVRRYSAASSGDDAVVRGALGLRPLPAENVWLVSDETVCSRAAAAYCAAMERNPDTCTGKVFVVVAADRFVVFDPEYRYERDRPSPYAAVFDSAFRHLSTF